MNNGNKRVTRSMAARTHVPATSDDEEEPPRPKSSSFPSSLNLCLAMGIVVGLAFVTVRFTMSRELQQLDNAIKDMDKAYFHNLTTQLSQMYSQLRQGHSPGHGHGHPARTVGSANRLPRIDHAQFSQGAKIIRFSGDELANPGSYGERVKQLLGVHVPKGACRLLGPRLNKNKFLTFRGDRAKLMVELNQAIFLDTFKIEHYIANVNDTDAIGLMPKNLIVSGIRNNSNNAVILGQLKLPVNRDSNMQAAVLQLNDPRESFEWFQVEVLSNHGRKDMTRMYKIGMYGEIDESK